MERVDVPRSRATRSLIFLITCMLPLVGSRVPLAHAGEGPEYYVGKLELALRAFSEGTSFSAHTIATLTGGEYRDETEVANRSWKVQRKGKYWKFAHTGHDAEIRQGRRHQRSRSVEVILREQGYMIIDRGAANAAEPLWVVAELATAPQILDYRIDTIGFVFGIVRGAHDVYYLPDILNRSSVTAHAEVLNGSEVIRMTAAGAYGDYTVWLAPQQSYLPIKVHAVSSGQHAFEGGTVASSGLLSFEQIIEVSQFAPAGGHEIPSQYRIVQRRELSDGTLRIWKYECAIRDVVLNHNMTSEDFRPSTVIPDGFEVQVDDSPNIAYVWSDGMITKAIDSDVLRGLRDQSFQRSAPTRRWLVWGNLLALSILAMISSRKWWTRRR